MYAILKFQMKDTCPLMEAGIDNYMRILSFIADLYKNFDKVELKNEIKWECCRLFYIDHKIRSEHNIDRCMKKSLKIKITVEDCVK